MIQINPPGLNHLVLSHWESVKKRRIKVFSDTDFQNIEQWLGMHNYTFEDVVKATPSNLRIIANQITSSSSQFPNSVLNLKNLYKDFSKSSSNWGNQVEKYNARILIKKLQIEVCPYCNRNYIRNLKEKRTAEIDHFFPKEAYPFLALSFYNLIPSCKTCNQTMKGKKLAFLNPYDKVPFYKKFRFKLKIKNISFANNKEGFEIDYEDLKESLKENFKIFEIKELYDQHKDIILDIIQKKMIYSEDYVDDLFKRYEGTLFKNREDVLRYLVCNYTNEENFHNRPLSKLTYDIIKYLNLL